MLETQPKWYRPAPKVLGWHIGLWNLIGAIGFTVGRHSRSGLVYLVRLANERKAMWGFRSCLWEQWCSV